MMYIGVFCCMCMCEHTTHHRCMKRPLADMKRGSATKDIALWRDLDNKNTAPVVPTKIYKNRGIDL